MKKDLPAFYYLDHFHEFLAFFDGPNGALLNCIERSFIDDFKQLPKDQQAILVRAASRKYPLLVRDSFRYDEINQPQQQLTQLAEEGWLGRIDEASIEALSAVLTKEQLLVLLRTNGYQFAQSTAKATLLAHVQTLCQQGTELCLESLENDFLWRRFDTILQYLLFLYFGHTNGKLNQFSMRDLGVMRTRADATAMQQRFESVDSAHAAFFYASHCRGMKERPGKELLGWLELPRLPLDDAALQSFSDKFYLRLGQALLSIDADAALQALACSRDDTATEKRVRELYKLGRKDEVQGILQQLIDDPPSEALLAFAEDFSARKFGSKRTSILTDMLRQASNTINIDQSFNQSVERGVIAHYKRHNISARHSENHLWRSLFGLVFWSELFELDTLVSEFDRLPQALKLNQFYHRFGKEIEQRLAQLSSAKALMLHISRVASEQYGKVNRVFQWHQGVLEPLSELIRHAPIEALHSVLRAMSRDFKTYSDGFPDLMVIEGDTLRFEEVKSPGDQLRRNQLLSIQCLSNAGFDVHVTQVRWIRDPLQPYAVIDIETTGGGAQYHRITEIGVVIVVNGEVVKEWQTLLNPKRHIPSAITRLTGISNDMVQSAPEFSEVADELAALTEDCVFVAHNVNFDFGFIKQEFARLGYSYRRPKFCTCAQMRRVKPGLKSYSLAALTTHFGIPMQRHHRALSDAKAAAELLQIILTEEAAQ